MEARSRQPLQVFTTALRRGRQEQRDNQLFLVRGIRMAVVAPMSVVMRLYARRPGMACDATIVPSDRDRSGRRRNGSVLR
jgi:hypothetical protein